MNNEPVCVSACVQMPSNITITKRVTRADMRNTKIMLNYDDIAATSFHFSCVPTMTV